MGRLFPDEAMVVGLLTALHKDSVPSLAALVEDTEWDTVCKQHAFELKLPLPTSKAPSLRKRQLGDTLGLDSGALGFGEVFLSLSGHCHFANAICCAHWLHERRLLVLHRAVGAPTLDGCAPTLLNPLQLCALLGHQELGVFAIRATKDKRLVGQPGPSGDGVTPPMCCAHPLNPGKLRRKEDPILLFRAILDIVSIRMQSNKAKKATWDHVCSAGKTVLHHVLMSKAAKEKKVQRPMLLALSRVPCDFNALDRAGRDPLHIALVSGCSPGVILTLLGLDSCQRPLITGPAWTPHLPPRLPPRCFDGPRFEPGHWMDPIHKKSASSESPTNNDFCGLPHCKVSHVDENGCSALHHAANHDKSGTVALLLMQLEPRLAFHCDKQGKSPLHHAISSCNDAVTKILCDLHPGMALVRDLPIGETALHLAVRNDCLVGIANLAPISAHVTDNFGLSPLHCITSESLQQNSTSHIVRVCRFLRKHGAVIHKERGRPWAKIECREKPILKKLLLGRKRGSKKCMMILMELGVEPNSKKPLPVK